MRALERSRRDVPPFGGAPRVGDVDDVELIRRAQLGDHDAFGVLVLRHRQFMQRIAARVGGPGSPVDDICQVALTAVWRGLPSYRGDAAFTTWLYRIVANAAIRSARSGAHSIVTAQFDDSTRAPLFQIEARDPAAVTAELDLATRVLSRLRPEDRALIVAADAEQLSGHELAEVFGVSEGTCRVRLHRARAACRSVLEEMEAPR